MRLSIKAILLFAVWGLSFSVGAQLQQEVDSIQQAIPTQHDSLKIRSYVLLFDKILNKDREAAKLYLDTALVLSTKIKKEKGRVLHKLGKYYYRKGNHQKVLEISRELFEVYRKDGNKSMLATSYNNVGMALERMGLFEEAVQNILTSMRMKDTMGFDSKSKEKSYISLVRIYGKIGNIEKSNYYNGLLEEIHLKEQDSLKLATDWNNYAVNYKKSKQYDQALRYYKKSIPIYEKLERHKSLALSYNNLGNLYRAKDSMEVAENYFLQAKQSAETANFKKELSVALHNLGLIRNHYEDYDKALDYFKASEKISKEIKNSLLLISTYIGLANAYEGQRDYKNAFGYAAKRIKLKDSLFERQSIDKINELEVRYQSEIKEQQITLQENEIALLEQEAKLNGLQRTLLGTGLGLSVIVLGLAFYGFRQRSKRNALAREKVESELAFKRKELTTHALHLAKKNEVLESIKEKAQLLKHDHHGSNGYQKLIQTIDFDLQSDNNWENFARYFEQVHKDFNKHVKQRFPEVTPNELRLMALLKMNLSSKEIANILNISQEGIKKARYRLRKKLDIASEDSLQDLILSL